MAKLMITGGTGSGKTFFAIEKAKELGNFLYLSPTAMLTGESFVKYRNQGDGLMAKGS